MGTGIASRKQVQCLPVGLVLTQQGALAEASGRPLGQYSLTLPSGPRILIRPDLQAQASLRVPPLCPCLAPAVLWWQSYTKLSLAGTRVPDDSLVGLSDLATAENRTPAGAAVLEQSLNVTVSQRGPMSGNPPA